MIGLFEHMHQRQLSCAIFADSKTLITAGLDYTIAVWAVTASTKMVDLQPKATLFGLLSPVIILAISRSYSTLLSVTSQGQASLWDLNRLLFIRNLADEGPVEVFFPVLLCGASMLTDAVCPHRRRHRRHCPLLPSDGGDVHA